MPFQQLSQARSVFPSDYRNGLKKSAELVEFSDLGFVATLRLPHVNARQWSALAQIRIPTTAFSTRSMVQDYAEQQTIPAALPRASVFTPQICANGRVPDGVSVPGPGKEQPAVFFGHYWLAAEAVRDPLASNVACVDYSAGYGGPLVAYRFEGERVLNRDKFVAVK